MDGGNGLLINDPAQQLGVTVAAGWAQDESGPGQQGPEELPHRDVEPIGVFWRTASSSRNWYVSCIQVSRLTMPGAC